MLIVDYTSKCKNWNSRGKYSIIYIVIHSTLGKFEGAIDWMCNPKSQVSAHYCISKCGAVVQLVDDKNNAWSIGNALYNRQSISIELESWDGSKELTQEQDYKLAELVRTLMKKYNILPRNLTLHRHLNTSRSCPITFTDDEWINYRRSHFEEL